MATRKVLQEIPVLPPQTEEPTYEVVPGEAIPDLCHHISSFPTRAHAKYISNDESKENITPAEFDTKEKSKYEKSDGGWPSDLMVSAGSGAGGSSGSQQKDEMTAGGESIITPRKDADCSDWRIGESNTPLDFCKVTVDDFGISSESFTNCVGKSPKSLHKHRRRSTIGVRGSPEMNFLIRQIALQRSNRKSNPEPQSNTFVSPRNSLLKDKMSSFRNAFQSVEETEGKLAFPGFSEEEEPSDTRGSNVYGNAREKVEPPEKRKRVCDMSLPEIKRVPVLSHEPLWSTQSQKTTQKIEQVPVMEKISEPDDSSPSKLFSMSVKVQNEEIQPVPSSTRVRKRKVMFADLLSSPESKKTSSHNQTHKFDCHTSSVPVLRPVLKRISSKEFGGIRDELGDQRVTFLVPEPSENESSTLFKKTVSDSVKKKKRVTFGRELSPELFDKTLPPNTPLRRGSTPYRQHPSDTATPTAQETVHQTPCQSLGQPDFDCKDEEDTFKPLSLCFDTGSPSQDSTILFASSGKNDQVWPTEEHEDETLENIHTEENIQSSYSLPDNSSTAAPTLDTEFANETFIASKPDTVPANRVTRSCNKSKACSSEDPPTGDNSQTDDTEKVQQTATAKPSKRGRKPVFKKVLVKAPRGKGKKSRGRPKKSIQKPFYGEREIVSKKPLLSPIPELPEGYPTPPASAHSRVLKKGLVRRIPKRKGIQRDNGNVQKSDVHSEVMESVSDPVILKFEDVTEDSSCPEQEDLAGKHTESLTGSQGCTEPADLVVQGDDLSAVADCTLSAADKEIKQDEECILESGESVPENTGTGETMTALKPQNKSKRRSTTRRRTSQATTDVPHVANPETPTDLTETLFNAEHNTIETVSKDPKPDTDLLVEDQAHLLELPAIGGRKGRRSSRNYLKPAISSTESNILSQDPCTMLPHPDENVAAFTGEPCLPIDEILQSTGTEKKVRRSMRLRRDSGASGLFWVQEKTNIEGTSRRKSLSSVLQPLGNSNLSLESVSYSPSKEQVSVHQLPSVAKRRSLSSAAQSLESSKIIQENEAHSPNKEHLNVQKVPSASKKTRRRTLCTSSLHQTTSLSDTKRRRSNVSYKDSYVPLSAESQTSHNNVMMDA